MDAPDQPTVTPLESDDDKARAGTREANQEVYLQLLREGHSYIEAGNAIGIARTTNWTWRQDPVFSARCIEAKKVALGDLENEAHRRAMKGSDKLLMFLLQSQAPEKYNLVQKVEHSGDVSVHQAILAGRKRSGV